MPNPNRRHALPHRTALFSALLVVHLAGAALRAQAPGPDTTKPVKVYILAGQSNMVGMGTISGARCRYTGIYLTADPAARKGPLRVGRAMYKIGSHGVHAARVFTYAGAYDPARDLDATKPVQTAAVALGVVQNQLPTVAGPHTHRVRGLLDVPESGTYQVRPGYGESSYNVMQLAGRQVYHRAPGGQAVLQQIVLEAGKRYPFEITYCKGGSTALWLSRLDLVGKGDLDALTRRQRRSPNLVDGKGGWTVRNDVYFQEARIRFKGGLLTPGVAGKTFGPELGFGHVLGDHHDEQVLLIKTAMGNRALGWDFRPPSSGRRKPGDKWEGLEYRLMIEGVRKTLGDIAKIVPNYRGQGYEIAGFAWWQGHKDGFSAEMIAEYEQNLVHLIQDVRAEFKVPKLPVVVATVGFGGYSMAAKYRQILAAQMAVGDPSKHPEFNGTVRSVDTRDFWRGVDDSPANQDYHYNRNAETYLLVGDALGRAMVDLHQGRPAAARSPARPVQEAAVTRRETPQTDPRAGQAALAPIILDGIIPQYIGKNRVALLNAASGERSKRVTPFLRDASYGLTELYRQAGIHDYDWRGFGPDLKNVEWDYFSFDPKEQLPKDRGARRYRKVTWPDGMANWSAVDFDAQQAGWRRGRPPFGQVGGQLPQEPPRKCSSPFCGCSTLARSLWEKEVLSVRNTFACPPLKPGHRYRIVIGGSAHVNVGEGYAIYVNGKQLIEYPSGVGRRQGGQPRGAFIDSGFVDEFGRGTVTLAATSFLRYFHPRRKQIPPEGHFDLWLEEMKNPPLGHTELAQSATTIPMLSTRWQATRRDADKHFHDGSCIANARVLGRWQTIDQVETIDAFTAANTNNWKPGRPRFTQMTFKAKGETGELLWIWSGDQLMDLAKNQVLKMTVKTIGDDDYLFIEAGGFSTRNPKGWRTPWLVLRRPGN